MKVKSKSKKKNPTDLTIRNNNARKKEIESLFLRVEALEIEVNMIIKKLFPKAREISDAEVVFVREKNG